MSFMLFTVPMSLFTISLWLLTECYGKEVIVKSSKVKDCIMICDTGCCYNVTRTCCNTTCGGGDIYCVTFEDDSSLLDVLWRFVFIVPFVVIICGLKKLARIFRDSCTTQRQERYRDHPLYQNCTGDNSQTSIQDSTGRPLVIGIVTANNSDSSFTDTSTTDDEINIGNILQNASSLRRVSSGTCTSYDQYIDNESCGHIHLSVNHSSSYKNNNIPPPSYEDATKNDPPRYRDVISGDETR